MGLLHDGEWEPTATRDQYDHDSIDDSISHAPDAQYPPAEDRYHLYLSRACPWAHRTALVRRLLGLEDVVTVDVVDPVRRNEGWEFSPEKAGCTAESVFGYEKLYEVYRLAGPTYTGRVTVPVLLDRETTTLVNEESADIARMLATVFEPYQTTELDLYPDSQRGAIDDAIDDIHESINTAVYRAGFADTQSAYEAAVSELFEALSRWNKHLADSRFVVGDSLTLADVFLFPTLYRFDSVYHTHFKCTRKRLVDYDHLWAYARDVYQTPGVPATCNMDHVTAHYYRSHDDINPTGLVAVTPDADWTASHTRSELGGRVPLTET